MRYIVCGEALIDLVPDASFSPAAQETRWRALTGGSSLNTAVALARLGADSHFMGRVGRDSYAAQIRRQLVGSGVAVDMVVETHDPTTLAVVSLDVAGQASYSFYLNGTSSFGWLGDMPELDDDDWFHFGSLITMVEPAATSLLRYLGSTPATVSYDMNVRPSVMADPMRYWEQMEPFLAATGRHNGIVKASDEDVRFLVGGDPHVDVVEMAHEWVGAYGLSMMVMTLGPDGAIAVRSDGRIDQVPGRRAKVVDTVGAGDTFMAGFLTGYERNPADVGAALERGVAAATIVCERTGANPPTAREVERLLAG